MLGEPVLGAINAGDRRRMRPRPTSARAGAAGRAGANDEHIAIRRVGGAIGLSFRGHGRGQGRKVGDSRSALQPPGTPGPPPLPGCRHRWPPCSNWGFWICVVMSQRPCLQSPFRGTGIPLGFWRVKLFDGVVTRSIGGYPDRWGVWQSPDSRREKAFFRSGLAFPNHLQQQR